MVNVGRAIGGCDYDKPTDYFAGRGAADPEERSSEVGAREARRRVEQGAPST